MAQQQLAKCLSEAAHLSDAELDQASGGRDAASGMATGRRQYKPFTIVKLYDKASPILN
ncbi:hypothetical protein JQ604_12855 [Bradyrhizobium jicamae]|uniref:hypothetical protein n=1 Tax=Bradyrhizobium jicamae TaxID=280332 RepID=UPI001BA5175B|nr:hypothetical protein [Bradyrhizobium jicamae]MBR0753074.1 hypothetical protein [Bradyrhizobium jicamae]